MNSPIQQTIQLARGACFRAPVVPDTRILVQRGTIVLRPPPEWPADTFFQAAWRLDAEECHVTAARGYVELTALEDAEVLIIPPEPVQPSLADVLRWLRKVIQPFRIGVLALRQRRWRRT